MADDIATQNLDEVTIDDLTLKTGLSDNDHLLVRDAEGNDKKIAGSAFTTPSKLQAALALITALFPDQASADNQLADKNFVNSSIETNTATFRGTFQSVEALNAYTGDKTNNDYAFVMGTDTSGNTSYQRYKYNGTAWEYEYTLNNSSFTAAQWAAITSGITAELVEQFKEGANSKTIVVTAAVYKELEDAGEIKTDVIYGISDRDIGGINVDQSYQAGSANPQSGAAIEEALGDYAKTSDVYPKSDVYTKDESNSNFPRFPDYTQRINIGTATTWTATEDCYVNYVNNSDVLRINNTIQSVSANNIIIFSGYIKKNDILSSTSLRSDWGCCKIYKLI